MCRFPGFRPSFKVKPRKDLSSGGENRQGMGKRYLAECCVVRRQDLLPESGLGKYCTARLEANLREVVPQQRWRAGADSILAGACIRPDDRALSWLQTESRASGQRSL